MGSDGVDPPVGSEEYLQLVVESNYNSTSGITWYHHRDEPDRRSGFGIYIGEKDGAFWLRFYAGLKVEMFTSFTTIIVDTYYADEDKETARIMIDSAGYYKYYVYSYGPNQEDIWEYVDIPVDDRAKTKPKKIKITGNAFNNVCMDSLSFPRSSQIGQFIQINISRSLTCVKGV